MWTTYAWRTKNEDYGSGMCAMKETMLWWTPAPKRKVCGEGGALCECQKFCNMSWIKVR